MTAFIYLLPLGLFLYIFSIFFAFVLCVSYRPAFLFIIVLAYRNVGDETSVFILTSAKCIHQLCYFLVLLMLFKVPLQTVSAIRNRCGRSLPAQHIFPTLCFTQKLFFQLSSRHKSSR
jgi:hypothetical protein